MPSVRIGSLFGIPIKLGASFLLVLPVIAYLIGSRVGTTVELLNGLLGSTIDPIPLTAGTLPWVLGLIAALGLFVGVLLHELGHSLVARQYGVTIDSITLWFLGGLAQLEEFPDRWTQELSIAIAGPIVSVVLGTLCYVGFVALPDSLGSLQFILGYLAVLNIVLAVFNLLPGFPMDGGRVLRALLSRTRPRLEATRIAAGVGKGFAVLLGIGGILLGNLFWIAIAFFIFMGATGETRQMVMEAAFEGIDVGDIMTPASDLATVSPSMPLSSLVERMVRERHTGYPVVGDAADSVDVTEGTTSEVLGDSSPTLDADGDLLGERVGTDADGDLVGIVTLSDVQSIDPERRDAVTVADVMSTELSTVTPDTDAEDAIRTIQQEGVGRLLVTDDDGNLAGLISRTDLMTVLEVLQSGKSAALGERAVEPSR